MSSPSSKGGTKPEPRRRGGGFLSLLIALAVGGASGYAYSEWEGRTQHLEDAGKAAALRADVATRDAEAVMLRGQLDGIAGELAVERAAREEMQRELAKAQDALGEARDQLAFYELLVPSGPQGGLDVRGAELERVGNALRYQVLLTRNARNEAAFSGSLQFLASGVKAGENVTMALAPMRVEAEGGEDEPPAKVDGRHLVAVTFTQYQRSQGLLALPPDFEPESVTVRVLEGDTVRVSRAVKVPKQP